MVKGEVLKKQERELLESARVVKGQSPRESDLETRLSLCLARVAEADLLLKEEQQGRSKAEHEVDLLTRELNRQRCMAETVHQELESFSYSISHDLRAPLRHLVGFSSALVEDYGEQLEPTAQSYLDCIVRAARKMEGLLEALLSLSRVARQDLTLVDMDLAALARQYADSLRQGDPERQVEFRIAEKMPVKADPQLMRTAIEHLLGNAWKFTAKKERATIEFGEKREGEGTVYYVRDDGAGFDLRFAERLFGPFQRMHREEEFPGLGIGLATVQRIVHRHGGKIWADAEIGKGATFSFTLSP
ncbi:histidine kinase [Geoanaerobacter pelophilus]|uniref:histidine kinase n=1 Tax=Geoanaerobacter pelophilus TaxID=60036 RepID=A0ABQ0MH31_9BACT|nr:histidine kinase [Geoanaerobacter pelophilus]